MFSVYTHLGSASPTFLLPSTESFDSRVGDPLLSRAAFRSVMIALAPSLPRYAEKRDRRGDPTKLMAFDPLPASCDD
jgi:hypothetical protein